MSAGAMSRGNNSGYNVRQLPTMTRAQQQLLGNATRGVRPGVNKGLDYLTNIASGEGLEALEQQSQAGFQKNLGQIGSQFAGVGAQDSSAFQNAAIGSASAFAQDLAAQRMKHQSNAVEQLLGYSQNLLGQRPFENFAEEEDQGFDWGGVLGGALGAFGGPALAQVGSGVGSWANKKLFG